MLSITERLARFSARRPWRVVGAWVLLLVVAGFAASGIGDVLNTDNEIFVDTESDDADKLLEERFTGPDVPTETVVVQSDRHTVQDPEFEALVIGITDELRALDENVVSVNNFYESHDGSLVSDDRATTILPVTLTGEDTDSDKTVEPVLEVLDEADSQEGFTVLSAGDGSVNKAFLDVSEEDLQNAEIFGLPAALIVLVFVFGALVAAGIPIVLALVAILISLGIAAVIGQFSSLSFFVVNFITTIGLAVGIDYSLMIVERFREERRRGLEKERAIAVAGATASRAVLFSGLTVVVALLGLVLVPDSIFRSLGVGAIIVTLMAVAAALTLLPAVLSLLGDRVNKGSIPFLGTKKAAETPGGFWYRTSNVVMRYPVVSAAASVALLVAASIPYFNSLELGFNGIGSLPRDLEPRQAFDILDEEFSGGVVSPTQVVVDAENVNSPEVQRSVVRLGAELQGDDAFGHATIEKNEEGNLLVMSVPLNGDPDGDRAHAAIDRLRDEHIPAAFTGTDAEALVTGPTAQTRDYVGMIDDFTPAVFAFVLGLSFVVLLLVFRSIVVPIKAIIMNLLSVAAAYGILVLVIVEGVGNEIFGFQQVEFIEAWLPLFMFAILFGLSMDYHVFLLSRIRERFDETGDNREAVAYGVRSTAGIITGAALIMVVVFAGFATGSLVSFQQMGFGLAVAVIIDATIIRTILVPASMALLGRWNWYLPSWLEWLPDIRVDRTAPAVQGAAGAD
jgi:RND superfamily putative drug exporter